MDTAHWIMLVITAALLLFRLMISAASSPKSRGYRWSQRVFWAFSLLWVSGSLGGIGLNALNLIAARVLGLPGYAALWMIARLA